MTELKTLKDLKIGIYCGECGMEYEASLEPVKQEAIKWVKQSLQYPLSQENHDWRKIRLMTVGDWMNFFNITEEDLK